MEEQPVAGPYVSSVERCGNASVILLAEFGFVLGPNIDPGEMRRAAMLGLGALASGWIYVKLVRQLNRDIDARD